MKGCKLITKALERKIPLDGDTDHIHPSNKKAIIRYYREDNNWNWYVVEYDPDTQTFYGLIDTVNKRWGIFALRDFQELNKKKPSTVKRDSNWDMETLIKEI